MNYYFTASEFFVFCSQETQATRVVFNMTTALSCWMLLEMHANNISMEHVDVYAFKLQN